MTPKQIAELRKVFGEPLEPEGWHDKEVLKLLDEHEALLEALRALDEQMGLCNVWPDAKARGAESCGHDSYSDCVREWRSLMRAGEVEMLRGELARRTEASPDERLQAENERLRRELKTTEAERAEWQGRFEEEAEDARIHRAALAATGRECDALRANALNADELAVVLGTLEGECDNRIEDAPGHHLRRAIVSAVEKLNRQETALRAALAAPAAAAGEEGTR